VAVSWYVNVKIVFPPKPTPYRFLKFSVSVFVGRKKTDKNGQILSVFRHQTDKDFAILAQLSFGYLCILFNIFRESFNVFCLINSSQLLG
jgi:hypothetical protein